LPRATCGDWPAIFWRANGMLCGIAYPCPAGHGAKALKRCLSDDDDDRIRTAIISNYTYQIGTFHLPWLISCCASASSQRRRECASARHGRVGTRRGLCAQVPSAPCRRSRIFDCASQAAARPGRAVGGARLKAQVGTPLFHRRTRGVALTACSAVSRNITQASMVQLSSSSPSLPLTATFAASAVRRMASAW
jgi:hypothetical protein